MILIPHDQIIKVPKTVAVCPYCDGPLCVQLEAWTQADDGSWMADPDCTHADCAREPNGLGKAWKRWADDHSRMPYVYQLPVDIKVTEWINETFRFDMDASQGTNP